MHRDAIKALSAAHLSGHRIRFFEAAGVDLIIGKRDGYKICDIDGREYWDCHLNGGTYGLGHRHPTLVSVLSQALETLDIGNHHFASASRALLAQELARLSPGDLNRCVYASGGGEAVDVAIRTARRFTGRRKVVAIDRGYHGRTGLSGAAGDDSAAAWFLSDYPTEFLKAPHNDADAFEELISRGDVACALMETIPATYGFPTQNKDFLKRVKAACERHGALYIADEVQTGLGRTGELWGCTAFGVDPDILITGKGLSGGLYPIAAAILSERVAGWLEEDGWGHVTTFGGAEPGAVVGLAALQLACAPATLINVRETASQLASGLSDISNRHPFLKTVHQKGLVIGLEFDAADGGITMMRNCYENGIWAIVANYNHAILQFKPGMLLSSDDTNDILDRLDRAIARA
jgi:putrescine aminotransferase